MKNKKHWYDGKLYDKLIAPNQDRIFSEILKMIEPGASIIDAGCGTARFGITAAPYAKEVVCIDLSSRNIEVAEKNIKASGYDNITAIHGDVREYVKPGGGKFDYAVMTYVIHEIPEAERIKTVENLLKVANKVILGDFRIPMPKGFEGKMNILAEILAGREHYAGFKSYRANGGLKGIAEKGGFTITREITNPGDTRHVVELEKKQPVMQ